MSATNTQARKLCIWLLKICFMSSPFALSPLGIKLRAPAPSALNLSTSVCCKKGDHRFCGGS